MVPSPESASGFQSRWPQASQNSLGGISRLPQRPHLMAVSRPSRAVSKNFLSVTAVSVTAEQAHENRGRVAAEGVGEAHLGAIDLALTSLTAKLGHDLDDLRGAGRADRVSLGLQAPRRIDGNLAAEARPAFLGGDAASPRLEQPEAFRRHDLGDGEAVVELDHVDVVELHDCFTIAEIVAT